MDLTTLDPVTLGIIAVVALVVIVGLVAYARNKRARTEALKARYGSEYAHAVKLHGSADKAEAELRAREKRVEKLNLVALPAADAARFTQDWRAVQARFVDSPKGALVEADRLVRELMLKRGYPMGDFEHRAADISVDHPKIVENYRQAHVIAERSRTTGASTEDMRQAVIHYRALFDELLEVAPAAQLAA